MAIASGTQPCPGCSYPTRGAFCVGCWGHPSWPAWLRRKITRGNPANRAAAIAQGAELIRTPRPATP